MRNAYLGLWVLAVCGLGCGVDPDGDDGPDGGPAGLDAGGEVSDAGSLPKGMLPRTGSASEGTPPDREPDQTNGSQAGEGDTATDTEQDGDAGDPIWMEEEDVNGDGEPETVTSLFDDETGDFYVWYTLTEPDCTTAVTVIFPGDGTGGEGDGSGRYVIDTTCDESSDLLGCEFDVEGEDTACGVCMRDELEQVWQCIEEGIDPDTCSCDVDLECSDDCLCDVECLEMCECDVDLTCSDGCECDFECVFECECDVDFTCSEGCECDFECSEDFCDCDVDFECTADCECDIECSEG
jgi:hypothetical protein